MTTRGGAQSSHLVTSSPTAELLKGRQEKIGKRVLVWSLTAVQKVWRFSCFGDLVLPGLQVGRGLGLPGTVTGCRPTPTYLPVLAYWLASIEHYSTNITVANGFFAQHNYSHLPDLVANLCFAWWHHPIKPRGPVLVLVPGWLALTA